MGLALPHPPQPNYTRPWKPKTFSRANKLVLTATKVRNPPAEKFIFQPFVTCCEVCGCHGGWGSYKTTAMLQIMLLRAAGYTSIWGFPLQPGVSCFISLEDNEGVFLRKLHGMAEFYPDIYKNLDAVLKRIHIYSLPNKQAHFVSTATHEPAPTERYKHFAELVRKDLRVFHVDWVVLDTVSRMVTVEDNNTVAMLMGLIGDPCTEIGAASTPLHHDTKAAQVAERRMDSPHAAVRTLATCAGCLAWPHCPTTPAGAKTPSPM